MLTRELRLSGLKGACLEQYVHDHSASLGQLPLTPASVIVFFFHNFSIFLYIIHDSLEIKRNNGWIFYDFSGPRLEILCELSNYQNDICILQ